MLMLREHFGERNVAPVTVEELSYTDLSGDDLLFLPGIPGERSPYPKILTPLVQTRLLRELERGLIIWTDCAATYEMMATMKFRTSGGRILTRTGTGWLDGHADGPVEGCALPSSAGDRFQHVTLRQVFYRTQDGQQRVALSAYGNGPGIRLSPREIKNPDVAVIGRYGESDDSPIATVTKKIGKGLLLSLGVLVQVSPYHVSAVANTNFRHADASKRDENILANRDYLHRHLAANDHLRLAYLDHLLGIVRSHYERVRNAESQAFSASAGVFGPGLLKTPA